MKHSEDGLSIGEFARQAGVNLATVRYYERRGMLPKPSRNRLGHRLFDHENMPRIRFIKQAQGLGFSLAEVQSLLRLRIDPGPNREKVRQLAEVKVEQIAEKVRRLRSIDRVLRRLIADCQSRMMEPGCPILEALDSASPLTSGERISINDSERR
jgi:MerR family mercuric resistance operon transcriptional regulator